MWTNTWTIFGAKCTCEKNEAWCPLHGRLSGGVIPIIPRWDGPKIERGPVTGWVCPIHETGVNPDEKECPRCAAKADDDE